ncbi:hypothetical protein J3P96_03630 [Pseudomonas sp. R3-56]|uniref:DUF6124 family protein n=1 Tax=Pseudomonas sp. R3-56 TaxID=2817401 RepID=UPI003DAA27E7
MAKITPNSPATEGHESRAKSARNKKIDDETSDKPDALFTVAPDVDMECLLANLSESPASANAMINDLAFDLEGSRRHVALGILQLIELSELLANRALDVVEMR